jgi:hypothetical protein
MQQKIGLEIRGLVSERGNAGVGVGHQGRGMAKDTADSREDHLAVGDGCRRSSGNGIGRSGRRQKFHERGKRFHIAQHRKRVSGNRRIGRVIWRGFERASSLAFGLEQFVRNAHFDVISFGNVRPLHRCERRSRKSPAKH